VINGAPTDRIQVTGGAGQDIASIPGTAGNDTVAVTANGTDVAVQGLSGVMFVNLTAVERLDVDLGDGGDSFSAVGNLAILIALDVDGGDGNDTLLGGNGADTIAGGPGTDFLDGNQGRDALAGGDGDDTVQWDPGDGSDTVTGGAGIDRLVFNASNAGELVDMVQAAGHVRLTRNIGTVGLDLVEIDAIDLRMLAGNDSVTIGDLTGSDVREVGVDLGAFGGVMDTVADAVTVRGTSVADTITVADQGSDVVVQGLPATVRIAHADATLDGLTVDGLEGEDQISATPGAQSLILLSVLP